jgi:hypothetical protein
VEKEETIINLLSQKPGATLKSMYMNIYPIHVCTCIFYIHVTVHRNRFLFK